MKVQDIKIPTHNGQWVVADLYKPRSATAENPAPLVVVIPGFQRSKEALANIAIELSRRGIVIILIDPYAQGFSSASMSRMAATTEGYGMFAVVDYVAGTPNLNYVDRERIGATGHSAGGNAAIRGANYFGREAIATGKPSKLHSVFVSGYVLTLRDDVLEYVRSNVGVSYAFYDEGAYRNELKNGDMRRAPEALRAVNSGLAFLATTSPRSNLAVITATRMSGRCAWCTMRWSCTRSSRTSRKRQPTRSNILNVCLILRVAIPAMTRSGTGKNCWAWCR